MAKVRSDTERLDDLQPGPELDALVAEKVMGWERLEGDSVVAHEREYREEDHFSDPSDGERWHNLRIWVKDGKRVACQECGDLPNFSTSIVDVWEVVEFLRAKDFQIATHGDVNWRVEIDGPEGTIASEWAPELPFAICLAALRAMSSPG